MPTLSQSSSSTSSPNTTQEPTSTLTIEGTMAVEPVFAPSSESFPTMTYGLSTAEVQDVQSRVGVWSYFNCPDIDECSLGLDDCSVNSTCINLNGSYTCSCDTGYVSNTSDAEEQGRSSKPCKPICHEPCVNGLCTAPDTCSCDLGWAGATCEVDCGCNFNAACIDNQTVGVCNCERNTTGPTCDRCQPGFYGNAINGTCTACQCNLHGDESRGLCDRETGDCFCRHYTHGRTCDKVSVNLACLF